LHRTCATRNALMVSKLLEKSGADVNAKSNDGTTPLHLTCAGGSGQQMEATKFLIENGARLDSQDEKRKNTTALCSPKRQFGNTSMAVEECYNCGCGREYPRQSWNNSFALGMQTEPY